MNKPNKTFLYESKQLITVFIVFLWVSTAFGKDEINFSIKFFNHEDGLPQNTIKALAQDSKGYIWIGTENGLVRFDGHRFKHIKAPLGKTVVHKINVDEEDRIWISWIGYNSDIYNPSEDSWKSLAFNHSKYQFVQDYYYRDGKYWLNRQRPQVLEYLDDEHNYHSILMHGKIKFPPEPGSIFVNEIPNHENLIIVSYKKQLLIYDLLANQFSNNVLATSHNFNGFFQYKDRLYACSPKGVERIAVKGLNQYEITAITKYPQAGGCKQFNSTLFQVVDSGNSKQLIKINLETETVEKAISLTNYNDISYGSSHRLIKIEQGYLLITREALYQIYNNEITTLKNFTNYVLNSETFMQSRDGNLWVGTDNNGLIKLSSQTGKFSTLSSEKLPTNHFRKAVLQDDEIWFGLDKSGIARYNRTIKQWNHYPLDFITLKQIRALTTDNQNNIYAGTASGELLKYNNQIGDFEVLVDNQTVESKSQIHVMIYTEPYLWLGSIYKLIRYNTETGENKIININATHVKALFESNDGNILAGTHDDGLLKFNKDGEIIKQWPQTHKYSTFLFSIYQDKNDFIWVGTWGGGLIRIHPETDELQVFNSDNSLNDNTIFGIVPGNDNELWLSTYNGLIQFRGCITKEWPCKPSSRFYNHNDGLQGKEFDAEAFALFDTGEIYFGGSGGANIFKPQEFPMNNKPPEMLITDIFVDNHKLINIGENIELPHDYSQLSIEFSAIDYHAPQANKYQYKTSSIAKWIDLQQPQLELNQLNTGHHQIEIRGSNNDGIWTEKPLKFHIKVRQPWYNSWYAWMIYISILTSIIIVWIKTLQTQVKNRTSELSIALQRNEQTLANVSHELKTPLTTILGPVEKLNDLISDEESKIQIGLIKRSAKRLDSLVEKILTLEAINNTKIQTQLTSIKEVVNEFISVWRVQAHKNQIMINMVFEPDLSVYCDRENLGQILDNLITNCIKYAGKDKMIALETSIHQDTVTILVKDNGIGMTEHELQHIYHRFYRGEKYHGIEGTGLGMNIVKTLVAKNNGSISINSTPNYGTEFKIKLKGQKQKDKLDSLEVITREIAEDGNQISQNHHQKIRVLIVDDEPDIRLWLKSVLSEHFTVFLAEDGEIALQKTQKHQPDVIIMDVMMPNIDGQHALELLKSDKSISHIPVIIISAYNKSDNKIKALKALASDFMAKPINSEELKLKIISLFEIKNQIQKQTLSSIKPSETEIIEKTPVSFIHKLINVLESNYQDEQLDAQKLSQLLFISESTLNSRIKKLTSLSAKQYITQFRIEKAKIQLAAGITPTQVCYDCGFKATSTFYRQFKSLTKQSPAEYQKQQIKS